MVIQGIVTFFQRLCSVQQACVCITYDMSMCSVDISKSQSESIPHMQVSIHSLNHCSIEYCSGAFLCTIPTMMCQQALAVSETTILGCIVVSGSVNAHRVACLSNTLSLYHQKLLLHVICNSVLQTMKHILSCT